MITGLRAQNFKSLADVNLEFGAITLLSGLNGSGKSSTIQSLLVLRQSYAHGMLPSVGLLLNGDLVEIGVGKDALFEGANEEQIGIEISTTGDKLHQWRFEYDPGATVLPCVSPPISQEEISCGLLRDDCHYLCAERLGSRTSYVTADYQVRRHRQLGKWGEYATQYLSEYEAERVISDTVKHSGADSDSLRDQTEAWIGEICPGTRVHFRRLPRTDLLSLTYSSVIGRNTTDEYRPTNFGFGVSYGLAVIIAALITPRDGLILVENPEAHLHPRGQMKMGQLLSLAASGGAQVVLETHSDHVLNGLRLAVYHGDIAPENVKLHHFTMTEVERTAQSMVESPIIDRDGRIDQWPTSFFDQNEIALIELLEPRGS